MGLFGFLKRKGETIELPPEEPEFLRKVDVAGAAARTAEGVKEQVEPELALWLSNGTAATGLKELASALRKMKAADYKEHVNPERNEIAEWVQEILNDFELARKLRKAKGKMQAAKAIEKGIKALKAAKKTGKKAEPKLPELHKTGYELQNIPLLDIPAEKPQMEAAKGGLFSRLFGKKPKEEGQEQPLESTPLLPQIPELPKSEEIPEVADESPETPIEMPRIEDFRNDEPAEPLTEETPETKKERKGFLGFLFKQKESAVEEQPTAFEMLPQLPYEVNEDKPELPAQNAASEFEPEPHHAKWEEMPTTAELPQETVAEDNEEIEQEITATERRSGKAKRPARQLEEYDNIELIRQDHELERTEKELMRQEEDLNSKRLELTRKRYELIKQKGELESKKFEEFIRKHKNRNEKEEALARTESYGQESTAGMPYFGSRSSEPAGRLRGMQIGGGRLHIPHGGIVPDFRLSSAYGKERLEELLEEAKQHIRQNNMEEAQRALHEVQSVFDTVYMTNNEKKQIEYEILEVEADLKLASLK